jgi:hypothetical protein
MAVRTTSADVILQLGGNYDTANAPSVDHFMDAATILVDDVVTCAATKGVTHSAAKLEMIERYITCHLYLHQDKATQEEKTADASAKFQGETGMGLDASDYGQFAMNLDTSGCLRGMNKGLKKVGVAWLGKAPSAQTDYEDRD